MTARRPSPLGRLAAVLVDPRGTQRDAADGASFATTLVVLAVALVALGLATLPRQLGLVDATLPLTGDPQLDGRQALLRGALLRLILADRLVPAPSLLVAGLLLTLAADPVLALARDCRRAVAAVVVLGLAPLLVQRIGELAVTYLVSADALPTPGDAVSLPHRFVTGGLLFWPRGEPAPAWLELLNARLNLITIWCVALWAVGLRTVDGGRPAVWHVVLPLACVAGGGLLTWILGPPVLTVVLGSP